MKRITKKPWFTSASKEIKWKDRGRPINWQGWAFTIFYVILMIILVLYLLFFLNRHDPFYTLILGLSMLPYLIVVRLTSDTDNSPSGITNADISKMLKEKRKNRMK